MQRTGVDWATHSWNGIYGCFGPCGTADKPLRCAYCYARGQSRRVAAMTAAATGKPVCQDCWDFVPHLHEERLADLRVHHREPRTVFVGSMGDMWDPAVPQTWRNPIWEAIAESNGTDPFSSWDSNNAYITLTKQPENMTPADWRNAPTNVCFGVTVEDANPERVRRWDTLETMRVGWRYHGRILCVEPILGPGVLDACLQDWNPPWVIVGPETGRGAEKPPRKWIADLVELAQANGIPVWMKPACVDPRWGYPDLELVRQKPEGVP